MRPRPTTSTRSRTRSGRLPIALTLGCVLAASLTGAACGDGGPARAGGVTDPATVGTTSPVETGGVVASPATEMHPGLRVAITRAIDAAADDGHHLRVNSGHRTPEEQMRLLSEEIEERGSEAEALRWVFPPHRSMHVQGLAVDVGDGPAAEWLDVNGARFGLCRTLSWEWWHFEWREAWERASSCPEPVDDPADAPGVDG